MLAFFDFYPIITQNDSFFELYREAFFWMGFNRWNYLLLLIAVFAAKPFARLVPLKTAVRSFVISLGVLGTWITLEYFLRLQMGLTSLYGKLSDHYYQFTESVVLTFLIHIPFALAYAFSRRAAEKTPFRSRFAGTSSVSQITLLTAVWITILGFPFVISIISLGICCFGLYYVSKAKTAVLSPVFLKDTWPIVVLLGVLVLLSFFRIGDLACNLPLLKECFTCRYY